MRVELSYGWLGYFMKYFGGVIMLALSLTVSGLMVAVLVKETYHDDIANFALICSVLIPVAIIFSRSSYLLFKYATLFTRNFVVTDSCLYIKSSERITRQYSYADLEKIVYIRLLNVIELHFSASPERPVALMNNKNYITEEFSEIKDFFLGNPKIQKKWI
ncbi:hypothetical protein ACJJH9_06880 [Microbulbifer sp. DLAB2-AF]|uniref:hypothetical protein n=1 Tax=Microbulbifer sp. DLAB2-AF TaxID=3243395 RepID=UPI004039AFB1